MATQELISIGYAREVGQNINEKFLAIFDAPFRIGWKQHKIK